MFKKVYALLLVIIVVFNGCATVKESDVQLPKQVIKKNINKYTISLQKIGDMLSATKDNDIYIAIKDITNKTLMNNKVPDDITGMLKTAFMNIGYKVHVVYSIDALNQIADKNAEKYVIEGEISEFEQTKSSGSGMNLGLSATVNNNSADFEYNNDKGTQVFNLALDLRVINANTGEYIPFVFAKNKIQLVKNTKSNSFSFFIIGNGFGMSGSFTKQNGVFSSLRLLSELSSVEIVGKLRSLPYWLALPNAKPNFNVINNYKRQFNYFNKDIKYRYIKFLLGFYYSNINDKNFNNYVILFKKKMDIYPADSKLTPELFSKLLIGATEHSIKVGISKKRDNLLNSIIE